MTVFYISEQWLICSIGLFAIIEPTAIRKMGLDKALTPFEKRKVVAMSRYIVCIRATAENLSRSSTAVATFLQRYYAGKLEQKLKCDSKLSAHQRRRLI